MRTLQIRQKWIRRKGLFPASKALVVSGGQNRNFSPPAGVFQHVITSSYELKTLVSPRNANETLIHVVHCIRFFKGVKERMLRPFRKANGKLTSKAENGHISSSAPVCHAFSPTPQYKLDDEESKLPLD